MPEVRISPGFLLLLALFVLVCEEGLLLCGLAAVAIHECGHILALAVTGGGVRRVSFTLLGGLIEPRYPLRLSPGREMAVCLAGPGANLAAAPLFAALGQSWEWGYVLSGLCVSAAFFNLLPVSGLDGGRALYIALSRRPGAEKLLSRITLLTGFFLLCPGVVLVLSKFHNPTLAIFGLWAIFRALQNDSSCEAEKIRV